MRRPVSVGSSFLDLETFSLGWEQTVAGEASSSSRGAGSVTAPEVKVCKVCLLGSTNSHSFLVC